MTTDNFQNESLINNDTPSHEGNILCLLNKKRYRTKTVSSENEELHQNISCYDSDEQEIPIINDFENTIHENKKGRINIENNEKNIINFGKIDRNEQKKVIKKFILHPYIKPYYSKHIYIVDFKRMFNSIIIQKVNEFLNKEKFFKFNYRKFTNSSEPIFNHEMLSQTILSGLISNMNPKKNNKSYKNFLLLTKIRQNPLGYENLISFLNMKIEDAYENIYESGKLEFKNKNEKEKFLFFDFLFSLEEKMSLLEKNGLMEFFNKAFMRKKNKE